MKTSTADAIIAAGVGTIFVTGGLTLAASILLRLNPVSEWWLAWAAYLLVVGVLVLRRQRWSAELTASVFGLGLGYFLYLIAVRGLALRPSLFALSGVVGLLCVYSPLRRVARRPVPGD